MKMNKKKTLTIANKKCVVIDGVFTKKKINSIYEGARNLKFGRYLTTSFKDGSKGYAWMLNLKTNQQSAIVDHISALVKKEFNLSENHLCRMYIHCLGPSDLTQPHRDAKNNEDGDVTAVLYLNPEWEKNWAGELLFFENNEASRAVSIKPGRLVLFKGSIEHCASGPSPIAPELRYSWVLKFTDKKNKKKLFDRDLAQFDDSFEILNEIKSTTR